MENITRSLFAAQLGITVASLLLGLIAEEAVAHLLESLLESVFERVGQYTPCPVPSPDDEIGGGKSV